MCTACELNAADNWKHTALDYCIRKGEAAKSELMVKNGAHMDPVLLLYTKRTQYAHRLRYGVALWYTQANHLCRSSMSAHTKALEWQILLLGSARLSPTLWHA